MLSPAKPEVTISKPNSGFSELYNSYSLSIFYTVSLKNVENRTIKVVCALKPYYGPTIFGESILKFDKNGYFDCVGFKYGGVFEWNTSITIGKLGLNISGEYGYKGNLSAYDENNNLLTSCDFNLIIKYKHKLFGSDEIKIKEIH